MHLRLLGVPSLTQIIYKEVTLFFQIMQIVLMIPTAMNIQAHARQGMSLLNQENANNVQVRK
jgi:hypothetical protein